MASTTIVAAGGHAVVQTQTLVGHGQILSCARVQIVEGR